MAERIVESERRTSSVWAAPLLCDGLAEQSAIGLCVRHPPLHFVQQRDVRITSEPCILACVLNAENGYEKNPFYHACCKEKKCCGCRRRPAGLEAARA